MTTTLQLRGVSKSFGDQPVLDAASLTVSGGTVHALIGQNGSGKSTLIKCLAGVYSADSGSCVSVAGHATAPTDVEFSLGHPRAADAMGIRFVHQDLGLVDSLNVVENLSLARGYATTFGTIRWKEQARRCRAQMVALGYDLDVRTLVGQLGPSQRTGVAIARALTDWQRGTTTLVLDEPTASLTDADSELLFNVIRTITQQGIGVLFVSHHLDEVFEIADEVTVLRDGRVVDTVSTATLDHDGLVELMVGRALRRHPAISSTAASEDRAALVVADVSGQALHGVSFSINAGEVVGVAGIAGSGREELAPVLFGARERRTGRVIVDGQPLAAERPDRSVAIGLGFVPADRKSKSIVGELTVRENVTLPRAGDYFRNLVMRHRCERSDVAALIRRYAVNPPDGERRINTLSGGNQQKVVLAKWIRLQPNVLLLDEPTQGIDVAAKAEIHHLIDAAAQDGMAVLVCSTDSEELMRLCSRVIVMKRGSISVVVETKDVTASHIDQLQIHEETQAG